MILIPPEGFKNAAELDDYMSNLSEEDRAELRPWVNVAYRDQLDAAAAEGIASAVDVLGHDAVWVPHTGIVEWVRLGILDALLKWFNGQAMTCIHMPTHLRPQPVWAAAWKPRLVVCDRCTFLLSVHGTPPDATCDGCGHFCKGMPDDGITPFTTFTGALGYMAGACDSCHREVLETERAARGA